MPAEQGQELVAIKLMNVERVLIMPRIRIGCFVRGRDQHGAIRKDNARHFRNQGFLFFDMLEHFERNHQIHRARPDRQADGVPLQEIQIGRDAAPVRVPHAPGIDVDRPDTARCPGQKRRSIAGAGSDIEHLFSCGPAQGEVIPVQVLIRNLSASLPGNKSLPSEIRYTHRAAFSGTIRTSANASQSASRLPCGPAETRISR